MKRDVLIMFKASQYNIILDLDEGAFVLRNLFSGKTIYVSPEKVI